MYSEPEADLEVRKTTA